MQIVECRSSSEQNPVWGITDTETLLFYPFGNLSPTKINFTKRQFEQARDRLSSIPLIETRLWNAHEAVPAWPEELEINVQVRVRQHQTPKGRKFKCW